MVWPERVFAVAPWRVSTGCIQLLQKAQRSLRPLGNRWAGPHHDWQGGYLSICRDRDESCVFYQNTAHLNHYEYYNDLSLAKIAQVLYLEVSLSDRRLLRWL